MWLRLARMVAGSVVLILDCLWAHGAWGAPAANVVVTQMVRNSCSLSSGSSGGLQYDFPALTVGTAGSVRAPFAVTCHGAVKVDINTVWGGAVLMTPAYRFDNGDTVKVESCSSGTDLCHDVTDNTWTISNETRTIDLKLTYTAAVAEAAVLRTGALRLSYH